MSELTDEEWTQWSELSAAEWAAHDEALKIKQAKAPIVEPPSDTWPLTPDKPGELTITIRNVPEDSPLYREATRARRCWGGHELAIPIRATYEEIRALMAEDSTPTASTGSSTTTPRE